MVTSKQLKQIEKTHEGRAYHNICHVYSMIRALNELTPGCTYIQYLACLYHDCVYDVACKDNEYQSAIIASKHHPDIRHKLTSMIMATVNHNPTQCHETNLFLDADLSILGSSEKRYKWYTNALRQEYSHMPEVQWVIGRKIWLKDTLARDSIFITDEFKGLESYAISNLKQELKELC